MPKVDGRLNTELIEFSVEVAAEAMFTVSPDGVILSANQAACERLEYARCELVGMRIADIDPDYPQELWPEHFAQLRRDRQTTIETWHRSKSGKMFEVEVSIAYFEFNGEEYCCSSIRDITERKQAERLLRFQQRALSRIASSSGDLEGVLTEICRQIQDLVPDTMATIMRLEGEENALRFVAGPNLTPTVCGAFEPLTPAKDAGSCGSAAFFRRAVYVEDTRTSPHWKDLQHIVREFDLLACWSVPIFDERQEVMGTFAISHTQVAKPTEFQMSLLNAASDLASIAMRRSRDEEQLRLAHVELAQFGRLSTMGEIASNVSHELNQPLASLVNDAFVLEQISQRETPDMALIRSQANDIREQAMRAGQLIVSLRNLAKKTSPTRKRVRVNDVVSKSLVLLESEIRHSGAQLEKQFTPTEPLIDVDQIQIQQALVNLIRNALEAMWETPRSMRSLTISTHIKNQAAEFRVVDTGPGIATDKLEQVFNPFHTSKGEGMGMGLAIARSIAMAHAGSLTAQSLDGGACFSLVVPLADGDTHVEQ